MSYDNLMNKQIVIILGLTPQGLSLLRELGKAGINTHAYYTKKHQVGVYSKYGEKHFIKSIQDFKKQIRQLLSKLDYKPLCYITSGELLATILREYQEIYEECDVISAPYSVVEKLAHKDLMYNIAIQKGFKVAKYCTLDKFKEVEFSFPLFIKRNYEIPLFFKTEIILNKETFNTYYNKIKPIERKDIIVQELIHISSQNLIEISSQSFFSKGVAKGFLTCNQKRRLKKGITSYIEELEDSILRNKVENLCSTFMKDLNYTGFAEFEFMYDKTTKDLYFIEVNTRTCGLQSSMSHKFNNIIDVILNPYDAPTLETKTESLKWMNIIRDIRVRIEKKEFKSPLDIFHSKFDIFDIHDLKPFYKQIFR